jgi:hypothetical protein
MIWRASAASFSTRMAGVYSDDNLIVLTHTKVPAVLLEAGIIVNRAEELLLETPEHRSRIAQVLQISWRRPKAVPARRAGANFGWRRSKSGW